ncbi:uncharacterized protein LOC118487310 [Helianthus annuus]|uniref:uncharacterized protein LOC118487310 n=1 Tax=Helianthus annuus TaxID=4232 RepID=UPI001652F72F|nr:uncharacterized protein LOC118487310 [Helianthus annuus]
MAICHAHFVVSPKSRKQTIQSIGTKWRNFKHTLYRDYIMTQKDDPEEKKNLLNPPPKYPFLKKEDWKLFVAQRTSKQWEETSKKAKKARAHHKYNHHLSRKGYARLTAEIMQETGLEEEEIDRAMLWKRARELKTGGFDSDVQVVVDRIMKSYIEQQDKTSQRILHEIDDIKKQKRPAEDQYPLVPRVLDFVTPTTTAQQSRVSITQPQGSSIQHQGSLAMTLPQGSSIHQHGSVAMTLHQHGSVAMT